MDCPLASTGAGIQQVGCHHWQLDVQESEKGGGGGYPCRRRKTRQRHTGNKNLLRQIKTAGPLRKKSLPTKAGKGDVSRGDVSRGGGTGAHEGA